MKNQVKEIHKICLFYYFFCHILGISLFLLTSNPITSPSLLSFLFWLVKLTSSFLFTLIGKNPGFPSQLTETQELQELDWSIPARHYCEICKITQPYRTRHCNDCETCISKYDHHCFWIGSCVGELNHFKFTLFLVLETLCLWVLFFSCFFGDTFFVCFLYFCLGANCFGFGILTAGLGGFHFYLISIGSSTWEVMRRKGISYLKPYPYNFHPFSKGIFRNWADVVRGGGTKDWVLPRPRVVYPFNWCENEYWSCC